ncbi:MAG: hypothetical protein JWO95_1380 [Verrucomicrobiales bacterium]|nr:hypothetical protein [Verrucomicrobiales bacterium]
MKRMLSNTALVTMAIGLAGCATTDRTIRDASGAYRPWEPAEINMVHSAVPVVSSTDTEKHIWTDTPVPNVSPVHDQWWRAD